MRTTLPRRNGAFDESDDRGLSRRQILRAGAWAAPIIVLATAAPAAAATSGTEPEPAALAAWGFSTAAVGARTVNAGAAGVRSTLQLQNSETSASRSAPITGVTVQAVYPRSVFGSGVTPADPTAITGAGWSFVGKSVGPSTITYNFAYTGSLGNAESTPPLTYDIATTPVSAPSATYVASSSAASPTSVTGSAVAAAPTYAGAAAKKNTFTVYDENVPGQGKVVVAITYDRSVFPQGGMSGNSWIPLTVPSQLTVGWQVVAIGPGAATTETIVASGTASAAPHNQSSNETRLFTLPKGAYRFEFRKTSVSLSPNPVAQSGGGSAVFEDTSTNPLATSTLTIT